MWSLADLPPEICADRGVVMAAIRERPHWLYHASQELRADREVIWCAWLFGLATGRLDFADASAEVCVDREVVLAAIRTLPKWDAHRYTDEDFRTLPQWG